VTGCQFPHFPQFPLPDWLILAAAPGILSHRNKTPKRVSALSAAHLAAMDESMLMNIMPIFLDEGRPA
jgi:hypothetical protein